MLADIGNENFLDKKNFIFEPKLDGIRAICYKNGKLRFVSRNGIDITSKYPEFDFIKNIKAKKCILDGEIVVYDKKGNPSFHLWQQKNKGENLLANYVVFDILEKDGKDLMNRKLHERRKILEKTVKNSERLQTIVYTKDGIKLWEIVKKRKLEGVIAKKDDSFYESGKRSGVWLKIKITKTTDCVILGYTVEKRALTSLALGAYDKGRLVFAGKVGTGFDETTIQKLKEKLKKIGIKKSKIDLPEDVYPVKSKYVAVIKYQNITRDLKFRAPVFLRLKED